eukprot:gb/GECG01009521.1/.p1 GENE.gb/GECG01009521.1/~~gb/GECG01009521.1/.p1  ORF type:complete len:131 (+),score=11.31 gb/GECG01009521.1/:1-393(+)
MGSNVYCPFLIVGNLLHAVKVDELQDDADAMQAARVLTIMSGCLALLALVIGVTGSFKRAKRPWPTVLFVVTMILRKKLQRFYVCSLHSHMPPPTAEATLFGSVISYYVFMKDYKYSVSIDLGEHVSCKE